MSDAAWRGDQGEMFRILNELRGAQKNKKRDGSKIVAEDNDKEREAWKEHFAKVSEDMGEVPDHVWANVTMLAEIKMWLGECPEDLELDMCVKNMNNKRRPGKDKFTTELLKYGVMS